MEILVFYKLSLKTAKRVLLNGDGKPHFLNIVRASFVPDFGKLESALEKRKFQVLEWGGETK